MPENITPLPERVATMLTLQSRLVKISQDLLQSSDAKHLDFSYAHRVYHWHSRVSAARSWSSNQTSHSMAWSDENPQLSELRILTLRPCHRQRKVISCEEHEDSLIWSYLSQSTWRSTTWLQWIFRWEDYRTPRWFSESFNTDFQGPMVALYFRVWHLGTMEESPTPGSTSWVPSRHRQGKTHSNAKTGFKLQLNALHSPSVSFDDFNLFFAI